MDGDIKEMVAEIIVACFNSAVSRFQAQTLENLRKVCADGCRSSETGCNSGSTAGGSVALR
jgi:hypothetical protein